jgi:hypothetical protein
MCNSAANDRNEKERGMILMVLNQQDYLSTESRRGSVQTPSYNSGNLPNQMLELEQDRHALKPDDWRLYFASISGNGESSSRIHRKALSDALSCPSSITPETLESTLFDVP